MDHKPAREKMEKVIEVLNKARSMELQAIYQYMNQHYNLDDMDYGDMAAKVKLIAVDEMRHAEMFAERIKELSGEPTVQPAGPTEKGQEVEQVFPYDVDLEGDTITTYNEFLEVCRLNGDSSSAKLFEEIIDEEQAHYNYFANVAEHIQKLGAAYLAQIAGTSSDSGITYQGFAAREGA